MSLFLLPEDVAKLTGLKRASAQLGWCKRNGVQAYLSAREPLELRTDSVIADKGAK